jgi:cob(I)alamin adenosyltransferase
MTNSQPDKALNERHKARMERQKEVVDTRIREAQRDQGIIVVVTGNGKGKSSSGFGMVARALGNGMKVGVVQFIKGAIPTGDEAFFRRFPDEVQFHIVGAGYTWETQDRDRDIENAETGWTKAKELLSDPSIGLVLLDELNIALKFRYLEIERVIADLQSRPPMQHVVITGRGAPPEIIAIAHTVSDISVVKHAFDQGIRAQKGVEL